MNTFILIHAFYIFKQKVHDGSHAQVTLNCSVRDREGDCFPSVGHRYLLERMVLRVFFLLRETLLGMVCAFS